MSDISGPQRVAKQMHCDPMGEESEHEILRRQANLALQTPLHSRTMRQREVISTALRMEKEKILGEYIEEIKEDWSQNNDEEKNDIITKIVMDHVSWKIGSIELGKGKTIFGSEQSTIKQMMKYIKKIIKKVRMDVDSVGFFHSFSSVCVPAYPPYLHPFCSTEKCREDMEIERQIDRALVAMWRKKTSNERNKVLKRIATWYIKLRENTKICSEHMEQIVSQFSTMVDDFGRVHLYDGSYDSIFYIHDLFDLNSDPDCAPAWFCTCVKNSVVPMNLKYYFGSKNKCRRCDKPIYLRAPNRKERFKKYGLRISTFDMHIKTCVDCVEKHFILPEEIRNGRHIYEMTIKYLI